MPVENDGRERGGALTSFHARGDYGLRYQGDTITDRVHEMNRVPMEAYWNQEGGLNG